MIMETAILGTMERGKHMGRVFTLGRMERYMMVNGTMDSSMGMACGRVLKGILTLESGSSQELRDMEFMYGEMGIGMKESGKDVSSMVMEQIYLPTVMSM